MVLKMIVSKDLLEKLWEYEPSPKNWEDFHSPPCMVFQVMRLKTYDTFSEDEFELLEHLIMVKILASILSSNKRIKEVYDDLWWHIKFLVEKISATYQVNEKSD